MQYFLLLALLAADAPRPNIIVFNVDDMGYADVGCFGSKLNRTPNVDRLAAEGMKLTCFYAAPVCSPSRAAMMTGCYPKRVGIPQVLFPGNAIGINSEETTLAELLKAQGYATICIGKWHLGDQPEFLPTRHGFDHYFGLPYSNDMGPAEDGARAGIGQPKAKNLDAKQKRRGHPPLPLLRDEKVVERVYAKEQATLTRRYTEEAVKFIRAQTAGGKAAPFFLYLPHTAVHVPLYPGEEFRGKSPNGIYSDWVEEVDWSLGQVVDAVRAAGVAERTLVIFTSDNGGTPRAVNAPLRGFKGSTLEGGMREPTVVWWPGKIAAGSTTGAVTSNMDLVPTLTKLAGGTLPANRKFDGHDIWPLLSGQTKDTPYEAFYYFQANRLNAVRSGPWKLELASGKLYNLETDIGEATDVAAANAAVASKLQVLAEKAKADLGGEGVGPGCRPPGRVQNARPIIDHDGNVRAGSQALLGNPCPEVPLPVNSKQSFENSRAQAELGHEDKPGLVPAKNRPNIVVILADDLGYGDLACYGATKIATPHCDRLAREGRRFTDAHSPSAVCSPTRFGLLSGCYPWRENRVPRHLLAGETFVFRDGEPTVASVLKTAVYATGCVGKWHLGVQRGTAIDFNRPLEPGPNAAGFDYYFGCINSHNQAPFVLVENDKILGRRPGDKIEIRGNREQTSGPKLRDENALEAEQAAKAALFIEKNREGPFFLYYPTAAVHGPITPGKAWQGKSRAGEYGDYVQEFDWAVGEVLAALDRLKLADNTIVVVTSDNGAVATAGGRFGHNGNSPLRGSKGTAYEGGHRVPFLVRWPGRVPAGTTSDETICHVDLLATLCAALAIELPADAGPDSWNVLPAWLGERRERPLREATICVSQNVAEITIRQGPWKLIVRRTEVDATGAAQTDELYNLADDPAETTNLVSRQAEKVRDLRGLLARYRQQGGSRPMWNSAAQSK
jgi:arylsulfatase A